MRRLTESMMWIGILACVPGCAIFGRGYGKAPTDEEIVVVEEQPDRHQVSKGAGVEHIVETPRNFEQRPTAKLLQGPSQPIEPLPTLDPDKKSGHAGTVTAEPVNRVGPTGVVRLDTMINAMGMKEPPEQTPVPPPAVDRKDLASLTLAMQLMIDGRHPEAIQALREYDDETQEFFLRLLPPLTVFAKTPISKLSAQEIAVVQELLNNLHDQLRTRCALVVNRMTYCKSIQGFANFDALPDNHAFLKATDNAPGERVQLYVELKNFASVKDKDGSYLTKLACKLELRDSNNKEVWKCTFDPRETTHRRSACLNDYHGNFSFYVPPIASGTYKLELQVIDETLPTIRRVARKSLDFRVTPVANQTTLR